MKHPGNIFGMHQSIRDMDILSEDKKKMETIESTHQAMLCAQRLSADYFVFHLAQSRDYWDWSRSEQMAVAIKAFRGFADFYKESGFTFIPLLENLEFPKFPATYEEMTGIFTICREFLPNLKLCFDIPHLWHSRLLLLETVTDSGISSLTFISLRQGSAIISIMPWTPLQLQGYPTRIYIFITSADAGSI